MNPRRILPLLCGLSVALPAQQPGEVAVADAESAMDAILLDALVVEGDGEAADPTGLDGAEAERLEPPFANDLVSEAVFDDASMNEIDGELASLAAVASSASAAEVAAGSERLDLRGFPVPRLRNGFNLAGLPGVINPERSETISGSLVPVVGRAAPGGIQNTATARPRGRETRSVEASASTNGQRRAAVAASGAITPKKTWYHSAASFSTRDGPQRFSELTELRATAALAAKHNRSTSTLWQLDYGRTEGNPAPGLVQYRATPGGQILGDYLPLAGFHSYGPDAGLVRRDISLAFQLETAPAPDISVSSGTQVYHRDATQDRFTTGQYIVSTGLFSGVREPTRREEAFNGFTHQTDVTKRIHGLGGVHKLRAGFEAGLARSEDENRGLLASERPLYLPPDVLAFDPYAPNYYRPSYSPAVYRRVIADREMELRNLAASTDVRSAFFQGKTVVAAGVRHDHALVKITDRRPGAPNPESSRVNESLSFHTGVNQRLNRSWLLFANASSAVEPSTRVDSRTGAIQDNQTTTGVECGVRATLLERKLTLSVLGYRCVNSDIPRRNPLYNDPVADPDHTQPQLVSSGEEEFRGLITQAGWKPVPEFTVGARATWTDAATTSSPDLPEEENRQLAGVPRFTAGASCNYRFAGGALKGFSLGGGATHIGDTVRNYARADRVRQDVPAYTLLNARLGYDWAAGKARHSASLSVANLLDTDLLARAGRAGADRSLSVSWRVLF